MTADSRSPILMYHAVGLPVAGKRDTFLNISAESFRRQIRALASLGYHTRPFGDIVEAWRSGLSLPRRALALTFDDAYLCVESVVAPILRDHGLAGTTFVVSSWTGAPATTGVENGRLNAAVLDWDGLRDLMDLGWEIGGHTATHPHLDALDNARAYEEIVSGKQEIEQRLGIVLRTFCYPFGHINERTPQLVSAAGFLGACTVRSGLAARSHDIYKLPRVKVGYRDGVAGLLYRLLVRPILPTFRRRRRSHTAA